MKIASSMYECIKSQFNNVLKLKTNLTQENALYFKECYALKILLHFLGEIGHLSGELLLAEFPGLI